MLDLFPQFSTYASVLEGLPSGTRLERRDVLIFPLRMHSWDDFEMYFAPFGYVNKSARVTIVGITPGWTQMEKACRIARDGLRSSVSEAAIMKSVHRDASFVGSMRENLLEMLDEIGLSRMLGIESCSELLGTHSHLLHSTSVIRYPTFHKQQAYSGYKPYRVTRDDHFLYTIETLLARELKSASRSLVIPLGPAVDDAMRHLIDLGKIETERCLSGFPHPSNGPGRQDRIQTFQKNRAELRRRCKIWLSSV